MELEIIDAFVDGERVDAAALKVALADPAGRDYLVDAWLLREAIQGDVARDVPMIPPHRAILPTRSWPWLRAAVFAGAVLTGYAIGYGTSGRVSPPERNPDAALVVPASPASAFPAPAPTRVIQLDFHVLPNASGGD